MTEELPEFPKNRGWPKGKKRGPKKSPEPTAEVKKPVAERRLKFKTAAELSNYSNNGNRLWIDEDNYPDGIDMQWVCDSIYGAHTPFRRAEFESQGWESVHVGDFDGKFDYFMPKGFKGQIEVDGLVLCARPLEFSIKARKRDRMEAINQVRIKENQISGGNIPQVNLDTRHPSAVRSNKLNSSWEKIDVPDDE